MKIIRFCFIALFFLLGTSWQINAEEIKLEKNTEFSVFTGMFDFSDDGKDQL